MTGPRAVLLLLLAVALLPGEAVLGGEAGPVGVVLLGGKPSLLWRQDAKRPLQLGELIYAGDRLESQGSPIVFLFCPSRERVELGTKGGVTLGSRGLVFSSSAQPARRAVPGCSLPRVALGSESVERFGGLRTRGYPPMALYLGGAVSSGRPTFSWARVPGTRQYRVAVRSEIGAVIWELSWEREELPYPSGQPSLPAGRYGWEVEARAGKETLARQSAVLEVRPDPELSSLQISGDADRLQAAILLENSGYYAEAASIYRVFRSRQPTDLRWTRRLAWLYWNARLIEASNRERARLEGRSGQ